jgi:bis(5'-nucleosyl)-tetraphosphatase (symmetrical)
LANYVVGDIQGCYGPLRRLLAKVEFVAGRDQLWCVGDLVNRGPQSLETLRYLHQLGSAFTGVLGNHDLHFLAVKTKANPEGKVKTLQPLLEASDCPQLFEWVRQLPMAHQQSVWTEQGIRQVLMVHAGIDPRWTVATTLALAAEVEYELRSAEYPLLLRGMYGDKPERWDDSLRGMERLRVITNVLTRLRFCTADGRMNLTAKGEAATAPAGTQPWFDFQQPADDELLLFGHWATLDGLTHRANIIGLDTGCVWGRRLTLLHLEKHERVSIPCDDMRA